MWTAGALAAVPFVTTLAPAQVIHDPGIILVTVATIAAATHALRLLATTIPSAPLDPPPIPARPISAGSAQDRQSAMP